MALIKRFESVSIDEDIESCVDIIETLLEYEDDLEMFNYKRGYAFYNQSSTSSFTSKLEYENQLPTITFTIGLKKSTNNYLDAQIGTKEDISNMIDLLQKSKSLLNKFNIYTNKVNITLSKNRVTFYLSFDSEEGISDNIKRAKFDKLCREVSRYITTETYSGSLGFNTTIEKFPFVEELKKMVNPSDIEKINKYGIELKLSYKKEADTENQTIIITTKLFKYKIGLPYEKWKGLKFNSKLYEIAAKELVKSIEKKL